MHITTATDRWKAGPALVVLPALLLLITIVADRGLQANPTMHWLRFALRDEPAHIATVALVVLAARAWQWPALAMGMLLGGSLLDIDHIPMLLGSRIISGDNERPYTHSLLIAATLILLGLLLRRSWRPMLIGAGLGVTAHLWRDLAVGGPVALFWPISWSGHTIAHVAYSSGSTTSSDCPCNSHF